jgi:hypothetical protein
LASGDQEALLLTNNANLTTHESDLRYEMLHMPKKYSTAAASSTINKNQATRHLF